LLTLLVLPALYRLVQRKEGEAGRPSTTEIVA
jgi:cobalt-zinc-cadmium resistance protein CzcA